MNLLTPNLDSAFKKRASHISALSPALQKAQSDAFSHFHTLSFPSNKLDHWKYTDLPQQSLPMFTPPIAIEPNVPFQQLQSLLMDPHSLTLVLFSNEVAVKTPDQPWFSANPTSPDWKFDPLRHSSLDALNMAFSGNEFHIRIPDHSITEAPIYIYHITESFQDPVLINPRHHITVGKNAQATLIEVYLSVGQSPSFTNTVTDITLAENACLTHLFLQKGSPQSLQIAKIHIDQDKHSQYVGNSIMLGGSVNRAAFHINLNESFATCQFSALQMAKETQRLDLDFCVQHYKPNCDSKIISRSVIQGNGKSAFTGKIAVQKNATKTTAQLENKNLLLSATAEANTRPQLEIDNDDVQCTHGATVGHLDPDALFYLISRGIKTEDARQLLIQAFIYPSLQTLPTVSLPYLENLIHEY